MTDQADHSGDHRDRDKIQRRLSVLLGEWIETGGSPYDNEGSIIFLRNIADDLLYLLRLTQPSGATKELIERARPIGLLLREVGETGHAATFSDLVSALQTSEARNAEDQETLRAENKRYGLPEDEGLRGLLRHIYNNRDATFGAKDAHIASLKRKLAEADDRAIAAVAMADSDNPVIQALQETIRRVAEQPHPFISDGDVGEAVCVVCDSSDQYAHAAILAAGSKAAIQALQERADDAYRLLGPARMVLDLFAEGRGEYQEAADMAQRIVDVIGHPVTDEPPHAVVRAEKAEAALVAATSREEALREALTFAAKAVHGLHAYGYGDLDSCTHGSCVRNRAALAEPPSSRREEAGGRCINCGFTEDPCACESDSSRREDEPEKTECPCEGKFAHPGCPRRASHREGEDA